MPRHPSPFLACVDPVFNVADEISDDFDLVGIVIRDLQAAESVFDHDHQFKTIEPVGPEIVYEVRLIGHTFDVYVQMLGNESADLNEIDPS